MKPDARCKALEADADTETVEAHRVHCRGCRNWIALRNDREYDRRNWDKHKLACPRLTGVEKRRRVVGGTPVSSSQHPEPPASGNQELEEKAWTIEEQRTFDTTLKAHARWEVDYTSRFVKAKRCGGTTSNSTEICDMCDILSTSSKAQPEQANKEAALPEDQQRERHVAREKYLPHSVRALEARDLQAKMHDPAVFRVWKLLEHNKSTETFIELYEQARDGRLADRQSFINICQVMADQVHRRTDPNSKLKHGARYPRDYMNCMVLMRSYGQKSAQQYSILNGALGGPCPRALRYFVKKSPDCLSDPDLAFENVARVKRLIDALKYSGPVALAGNCTKVRKRLTFSNDYGSHVLGAALPLEQCAVKDTNDIENFVTRVSDGKEFATQVRAILVKIPLPQIPPLVIALCPTKGNDDATGIHAQHMQFLAMAKQLKMAVISTAADGASSELCAQALMDLEKSELAPLAYDFPLYGVHLRAPVFETTGPLISVQDPPHARKTCRNQPQHGTHTASLGKGYVVNRSFLQLYETGISGLQLRDVQDVDKQDDGAARRMFHPMALAATTIERLDGSRDIRPEFLGLFPFCPWLLGTEFVEHFFGLAHSLLPDFTYAELLKLVKHVMLRQRILLSGDFQTKKERNSRSGYILDYDPTPLTPEELAQSCVKMPDHILNDLVALAFDEASQICKQLLGMSFPANQPFTLTTLQAPPPPRRKKGTSNADDSDTDDDEDDDASDVEADDGADTANDESSIRAEAAHYAARYAALSEDYEATLDELPPEGAPMIFPAPALTPSVPVDPAQSASIIPPARPVSQILDANKKVSIARMVDVRTKNQSGTSTRSERVIAIDQKFALARLLDPAKNFLSIRQAAHHLRVYQALTMGGRQEKTIRELRWQSVVKQVQAAVPEEGEYSTCPLVVLCASPYKRSQISRTLQARMSIVSTLCDPAILSSCVAQGSRI
ncbi:uncharacterized protein TRAVEDRAFT_122203 [Trametes versicolor FP-101664 SS1]|uniref:uncharacterized protein n=1 Tax=Trametes versicolor (strain FP-101664) TaxID=717944 RepID=UPI00046233B8|nr:uncharacterized protein TRAVEDRAFT_122203 [Trametes versicolor FP-101664 SS1]EIW59893.1 hypothetical protein TRAVEDRAFT_122203 [Trametes versicolor FP-101664 SS1]